MTSETPDLSGGTRADARAAIDSVIAHITAARRMLGEGHAISLGPLEELTRAACQTVAALPPEDRRALRELLEAVLYDLDTLSADLTARYGTLARRADHSGHRPPTVGDAYRRSDRLVPRPPSAPDAPSETSSEADGSDTGDTP
ncbi:MAG: hypothetical protein WCZ23_11355 [Rhodospirillaceae bacterium]